MKDSLCRTINAVLYFFMETCCKFHSNRIMHLRQYSQLILLDYYQVYVVHKYTRKVYDLRKFFSTGLQRANVPRHCRLLYQSKIPVPTNAGINITSTAIKIAGAARSSQPIRVYRRQKLWKGIGILGIFMDDI